uniref:Uncharacterized protein n=1 Tax=Amphimedon queenslandica TaxID=400682 RepID=A0A1X7VLS4_AMPQE
MTDPISLIVALLLINLLMSLMLVITSVFAITATWVIQFIIMAGLVFMAGIFIALLYCCLGGRRKERKIKYPMQATDKDVYDKMRAHILPSLCSKGYKREGNIYVV